jgi:hypothetical protein
VVYRLGRNNESEEMNDGTDEDRLENPIKGLSSTDFRNG